MRTGVDGAAVVVSVESRETSTVTRRGELRRWARRHRRMSRRRCADCSMGRRWRLRLGSRSGRCGC